MSVNNTVHEERVIQALLLGEWADFTQFPDYDVQKKPVLAAQFLRNLLLGLGARAASLPSGVRLRGAHVDGDLDLADCVAPTVAGFGVLALEECDLPGRIDVTNTQLSRLSIRGSRFRELWGEGVRIRGDVDFRETMPFPTADEPIAYIRLRAARIGGDVWGRGASLRAPTVVPRGLTMVPPALHLWMAKVDGSANFEDGFNSVGLLNFVGAHIGGDMDFRGARLTNVGGLAFYGDAMRVGGDANFSSFGINRFEVEGEMYLSKASIGKDLNLRGARLNNPDGDALYATGSNVGGNVVMMATSEHRFEADGGIAFWNATISGDLVCHGARLNNPDGDALYATGSNVGGNVVMMATSEHRFEADGGIAFWNATIIGDLFCDGARLSNPGGVAFQGEDIKVGGEATFDCNGAHRFEAEGEVHLSKASIGKDLNFRGAWLRNPGGIALTASGSKVGGQVRLIATDEHRFEADGEIAFWNATMIGDLFCDGARLSNPGGVAFQGEDIKVGGEAVFDCNGAHRFEAEGEVYLSKASIGKDLNFLGARLSNRDGDALDASGSKVGGQVRLIATDEHRFEADGGIAFWNAEISSDLYFRGARLSNPGGVAFQGEDIKVGGEAVFDCSGAHRFEAEGEVYLSKASIGKDLNFRGTRLSSPGGIALTASGSKVGGHVRLTPTGKHRFEADGGVVFWNVAISGDLACHGARLTNPDGAAFVGLAMHVNGSASFRSHEDNRFEAEGEVYLSDACIGTDLVFQGARLSNLGGDALYGSGCVIGAKLAAHDNEFYGDVVLIDAKIDTLGSFAKSAWQGAKIVKLDSINIRHIAVSLSDGVAWKERRDWLRKSSYRDDSRQLVVSPHPWREFATAFARSGRHADARRIQRAGYHEENRARPIWIRPFVWLLAEIPFGFGLSVFRATVTLSAFWFLGILGAETMFARNVLVDASGDGSALECKSIVPALYALDIAIPIIDLRQEMQCDPANIGQQGLFPGIEVSLPSLSFLKPAKKAPPTSILMFDEITLWTWAKSLYALFGALIVSFALITYSGVFKPKE